MLHMQFHIARQAAGNSIFLCDCMQVSSRRQLCASLQRASVAHISLILRWAAAQLHGYSTVQEPEALLLHIRVQSV